MKRKVLASILMLALTAGMIAGCGKKEVDYAIDESREGEPSYEVAQYKGEEKWTEEWTYVDKNEKEQTLTLNAEIEVPDVKNMRVVEVKQFGTGIEFWKQCMDTFFGPDTVYYYNDEEHATKEEIAERLRGWEAKLGVTEGDLATRMEVWVPDDIERYNNAPDGPVVAEEIECEYNCYLANRNDIPYSAFLYQGRELTITASGEDGGFCGPEEFRDYIRVYPDGAAAEDAVNTCKYSKQEAEALVDAYMNDIGMGSLESARIESLLWTANNLTEDEYYTGGGVNTSTDEHACYGYIITFASGVDGVTFEEFPPLSCFFNSYNRMEQISEEGNGGHIQIYVTDEGVSSVFMTDPDIIRSVSDPVKLLPLDSIKEIMKNEAIENHEKYQFGQGADKLFTKLKLMYMKIPENNPVVHTGNCSYIPVWCLAYADDRTDSQATYYHPIFVNAIDGSIIYP